MEGFQSIVTAIEEFGVKVEKMEAKLNLLNAKALESHVLPAEQRRREDIPMGFSRTGEESSFEDVLDRKEEEVLFASCRLVQIFNLRDYDADQESEMGLLDVNRFEAAYLRQTRSDLNSDVQEKARKLCSYWQAKISAAGEGMEEIPFKHEGELYMFKLSHGLDLYRMIRKGFREKRVSSKTGVCNKPWNYKEGREATVLEIMKRVQNSSRLLRSWRRRVD